MAEPIAIVGLGCRFPGASSPDELWDLLAAGVDATSDTPGERFDADALYSPDPVPGRLGGVRAGFIAGVDQFDAEFFGISAAEAAELDPQQRLLLMTAWEALEDAGYPPAGFGGTHAGVYVGAMHGHYQELQFDGDLAALSVHAVANYQSLLAGRLSFQYDLRGPSISLDTACSSSLVAVHLACQSLRAGETPWALAAGVNLKLRPHDDVLFSQLGVLAPDGRCKFGDASANGFAPSDGAGVVVLKPLDQARHDGDRVRAVILGSAVTNDGRSSGALLRPSPDGFTEMLRLAYEQAGVSPGDVDFIEAHGTGTRAIDPVELAALGDFLAAGRDPGQRCLIGSVKSNLGHPQGAAGIAGLIKAVLCLEHRQVPASLHLTTPNPKVPWDDLPITIPVSLRSLPDLPRPAFAGVSAQGLSATNAHVVLREAPGPDREPLAAEEPPRAHILALSARTPGALTDLAEAYIRYLLPGGPGRNFTLDDICFSAAMRRHHHASRLAAAGSSHEHLAAELRHRLTAPAGTPPCHPCEQLPAGQAPASSDGDRAAWLASLAHAYEGGASVRWDGCYRAGAQYVPLPTYRWQTSAHWLQRRDAPGPQHPPGRVLAGPGPAASS
jgi:acyl transferase domain-containing protein